MAPRQSKLASSLKVAVAVFVLTFTVILFIIKQTSPEIANKTTYSALYLGIFLCLFSMATLVGYFGRKLFFESNSKRNQIKSSFRQGLLLAILFIILMQLKKVGVLNLLTALLLLIFFTFVEIYVGKPNRYE